MNSHFRQCRIGGGSSVNFGSAAFTTCVVYVKVIFVATNNT